MEGDLKAIRKDAIFNGLKLGAILIILDILALYLLAHSQSILVIFLTYFLGYLIIPLFVVIILIKSLRKQIGGYWKLREATSGIFILFFSAYLISTAGSFIFVKYINPVITVHAKDNLINVLTSFLTMLNAEQGKIDKMAGDIEHRFEAVAHSSAGVMISNLLFTIIILFITALIFASIFKKEKQILAEQNINSKVF